MSWNIQKPGDYINGPLTVAGNVGIGTTTFTSIAGYTSLKINNATNGAILDLAQGDTYKGRVIGSLSGLVLESAAGLPIQIQVGGLNSFKADSAGVFICYEGAGGVNQRMQLNSTGLGIGATPELKLRVDGPDAAPATSGSSTTNGAFRIGAAGDSTNLCIDSGVCTTGAVYGWFQARSRGNYANNYDLALNPNGGNVGIGVAPSAGKGCLQISSGINFPATQVASTDANTLDDYEEGTWTGTLKGSVSDPTTPVTVSGRYTKIGRSVTIDIYFSNVNTTGASGPVFIAGLPFSVADRPNGTVSIFSFDMNGGSSLYADFSSTFIYINASRTNGSWVDVLHSAGTNRYLRVTGTYTV